MAILICGIAGGCSIDLDRVKDVLTDEEDLGEKDEDEIVDSLLGIFGIGSEEDEDGEDTDEAEAVEYNLFDFISVEDIPE